MPLREAAAYTHTRRESAAEGHVAVGEGAAGGAGTRRQCKSLAGRFLCSQINKAFTYGGSCTRTHTHTHTPFSFLHFWNVMPVLGVIWWQESDVYPTLTVLWLMFEGSTVPVATLEMLALIRC